MDSSLHKDLYSAPTRFKRGKRKRIEFADTFEAAAENLMGTQGDSLEARRRLFEKRWSECQQLVTNVQAQASQTMLAEVVAFASNSLAGWSLDAKSGLPTATLMTGVNYVDQASLIAELERHLVCENQCVIVPIRATSNLQMKGALPALLANLWSSVRQSSGARRSKKASPGADPVLGTISEFCDAYDALRAKKKGSAPVGFVFQFDALESFLPSTVRGLVSLLATAFHSRFPSLAILPVATTLNALHQVLPHAVTSQLRLKSFILPPPVSFLNKIWDSLLSQWKAPFRLSPRLLRLLVDVFLMHNFSVAVFLKGIKLCLLQHFVHNPLSVLCVPSEDMPGWLEKLGGDREISQLLKEALPLSGTAKSKGSAAQIRNQISHAVQIAEDYEKSYLGSLRVFECLLTILPVGPYGRTLREIYLAVACSEPPIESDEFQHVLKTTRVLATDDILRFLSAALARLKTEDNLTADLAKFALKLSEFRHNFEHVEEGQKSLDATLTAAPKVTPAKSKETLESLKARLRESVKSQRQASYFELQRDGLIEFLTSSFAQFWRSAKTLPLYKARYFDDLESVSSLLLAHNKHQIERALLRPEKILDLRENLSATPLAASVFQLYQEHGRVILLADWFRSFVEKQQMHTGKKSRKLKADEDFLPDFVKSISELEWLGFVKQAGKQKDRLFKLEASVV